MEWWAGKKTFEEPEVTIWHESYDQVMWFRSMMSQFHYNGFGATGFNYAVAYQDFRDMGLAGIELDEWKWKMKVMESEALSRMNKKPA